jgi:hypothetical protein
MNIQDKLTIYRVRYSHEQRRLNFLIKHTENCISKVFLPHLVRIVNGDGAIESLKSDFTTHVSLAVKLLNKFSIFKKRVYVSAHVPFLKKYIWLNFTNLFGQFEVIDSICFTSGEKDKLISKIDNLLSSPELNLSDVRRMDYVILLRENLLVDDHFSAAKSKVVIGSGMSILNRWMAWKFGDAHITQFNHLGVNPSIYREEFMVNTEVLTSNYVYTHEFEGSYPVQNPQFIYVPTSFSGGYLYGPDRQWLDEDYLDWMRHLLKLFNSYSKNVICKSHPKSMINKELGDLLNCKITHKSLEELFKDACNIYIFDYPGSAFFRALRSGQKIVYIDLGIRKIEENFLKLLISRRITYFSLAESSPDLETFIKTLVDEEMSLLQSLK